MICRDKPNNPPGLQAETRPAHLAYLQSLGDAVKFGGPLLADDGISRVGSLILLEAQTLEAAHKAAAADPYVLAGIFETVEIRPLKQVTGSVPVE